jgi:hypothetical protein
MGYQAEGPLWPGIPHLPHRREGTPRRGAAGRVRDRQPGHHPGHAHRCLVALTPAAKLAQAGQITLDGDASVLETLAGLMDEFDPDFPIVTP